MLNNCPDKANILQDQKKDALCIKQTPGSYSSKSDFILENEGLCTDANKMENNN